MPNELAITDADALIVVDVQNDFLPGGALPVAEGNRVHEPLNTVMPKFPRTYGTRDWHPRNHKSFTAQGGPWPPHCIQNTLGAAFSSKLHSESFWSVVSKGVAPDSDGYSAFDGTGLAQQLRDAGVRRVFVGGLATDYCVKATALDARRHGFAVVVLTDAVAAVKVKEEDEMRALREMRAAGCVLASSKNITARARAQ